MTEQLVRPGQEANPQLKTWQLFKLLEKQKLAKGITGKFNDKWETVAISAPWKDDKVLVGLGDNTVVVFEPLNPDNADDLQKYKEKFIYSAGIFNLNGSFTRPEIVRKELLDSAPENKAEKVFSSLVIGSQVFPVGEMPEFHRALEEVLVPAYALDELQKAANASGEMICEEFAFDAYSNKRDPKIRRRARSAINLYYFGEELTKDKNAGVDDNQFDFIVRSAGNELGIPKKNIVEMFKAEEEPEQDEQFDFPEEGLSGAA